jgi:hypothetical protein
MLGGPASAGNDGRNGTGLSFRVRET